MESRFKIYGRLVQQSYLDDNIHLIAIVNTILYFPISYGQHYFKTSIYYSIYYLLLYLLFTFVIILFFTIVVVDNDFVILVIYTMLIYLYRNPLMVNESHIML